MPVYTKDDKKVLFIHVPKTAGSSVNKLFIQNGYTMSYYSESSKKLHKGLCGPQHIHREVILEEFDIDKFDDVFSIYRDPVDRLLSEYTWAGWGLAGQDNYTPDSFEKWCPFIFKAWSREKYRFDNHIRPQCEFYTDNADVYDFDNIGTLGEKLKDKVGLDNIDLPYERSSRRDDREYVIYENTFEVIKEFYRGDYQWREGANLQ